jgi:hypothetical protein
MVSLLFGLLISFYPALVSVNDKAYGVLILLSYFIAFVSGVIGNIKAWRLWRSRTDVSKCRILYYPSLIINCVVLVSLITLIIFSVTTGMVPH